MSAEAFDACGVVSLTSDFGTGSPYVGILCGVILRAHSTAHIVHLIHDVELHWTAEASFWLERAHRNFPAGSVHVAVVEASAARRPGLVVQVDGHCYVGPDNGLLAPLAEREGAKTFAITAALLRKLGVSHAARTFRGRDVQAPVGGALAAGTLAPEDVGPQIDDWAPSLVDPAVTVGGEAHGVVVTVDGAGNVITNVPEDLIAKIPSAEALVGGKTIKVARSYADGAPGEILALVNALGVLEIARVQRSAADQLGVGRGAPVIVRRRIHRD